MARWTANGGRFDEVIDAACNALIADVDSPTLRELAGASPDDSYFDIKPLVDQTFEELGINMPGTLRDNLQPTDGAKRQTRYGWDSLRLEIVPAPKEALGFELQVFVNDVEMTSRAAGLGMDPYDLVVPSNQLVATSQPHSVPIARCRCGVYGCGTTDIRIVRDGQTVHWDWLHEKPMNRSVSFHSAEYDAEMARI